MKIIAIAGSGSGSGKTTLACRILRSIPGLGAVKISPGGGKSRVEWGPGADGKDTARYIANGAARVARILAPRERVAEVWAGVKADFKGCHGVIVEGASAVDLPGEKYVIFVIGRDDLMKRFERNRMIYAISDHIVVNKFHNDLNINVHLESLSHFNGNTSLVELNLDDHEDQGILGLMKAIGIFLKGRSGEGLW